MSRPWRNRGWATWTSAIAPAGREVGSDRHRQLRKQPTIPGTGCRFAHRRAWEPHGNAADHAALVENRHGHAVDAHRTGRHGEGVTVAPDAVEGGLERGTLADADATQDAAALFFGTKGDPGAAERTHQHRASAAVARRLERHRAF